MAGHQPQRFVDRQRRPDAPALWHVGDAPLRDLIRRAAQDLFTEQLHAAARRHQAGDRVAQRRLAHSVAADDAEHAVLQRQVDRLQRVSAAVVHIEAFDDEHRPACGRFLAIAPEPGHQSLLPMQIACTCRHDDPSSNEYVRRSPGGIEPGFGRPGARARCADISACSPCRSPALARRSRFRRGCRCAAPARCASPSHARPRAARCRGRARSARNSCGPAAR